jgi:peptidoglycan/LPS O-acetylase OafA/YrhL
LPGGFVGVDVFFVISGYLITTIILKEHSTHAFTLLNFWLRRVRRIMPAMLLMLLVSLVAGFFILLSESRNSLGWQSLSALVLSANTMMWNLTGNYWAPSAGSLPLLHTLSLSIEEQFYLVYPLFILGCLRWFPKKLAFCLAGVFALSLATCIVVTSRFPSSAFYSLSTRAWELAAGCFLAA